MEDVGFVDDVMFTDVVFDDVLLGPAGDVPATPDLAAARSAVPATRLAPAPEAPLPVPEPPLPAPPSAILVDDVLFEDESVGGIVLPDVDLE